MNYNSISIFIAVKTSLYLFFSPKTKFYKITFEHIIDDHHYALSADQPDGFYQWLTDRSLHLYLKLL